MLFKQSYHEHDFMVWLLFFMYQENDFFHKSHFVNTSTRHFLILIIHFSQYNFDYILANFH